MNRILGYFLAVIGLSMVFFALIAMYKVFAGGAAPVILISNLNLSVNTQYGPLGLDSAGLAQILNLFFHSVLMFFTAACGAKLANVGVNMVKVDLLVEAVKENMSKEIEKL